MASLCSTFPVWGFNNTASPGVGGSAPGADPRPIKSRKSNILSVFTPSYTKGLLPAQHCRNLNKSRPPPRQRRQLCCVIYFALVPPMFRPESSLHHRYSINFAFSVFRKARASSSPLRHPPQILLTNNILNTALPALISLKESDAASCPHTLSSKCKSGRHVTPSNSRRVQEWRGDGRHRGLCLSAGRRNRHACICVLESADDPLMKYT